MTWFTFIECGNLTAPSNGAVTFSSGKEYQSTATFSCDTGYTLIGNDTLTCQADETWSDSHPVCKINGKVYHNTCIFIKLVIKSRTYKS